jgi:zinc-ribbon domain
MEIILGILLLAAAFAVLAYPLYTSHPHVEFATAGTLNDLLAQRDGVYATLRDLDLDYQLGKLDMPDYQARRERYLARAAVLLQQLDALRGADAAHRDLSDEIEREVAALRKRLQTADSALQVEGGRQTVDGRARSATNPEGSPRGTVNGRGSFCTQCGRARQPGDRFCANCGQALS